MNQRQAYLALKKKAAQAGQTMSAFCEDRGVSKSVPTHWKKYQRRNVNAETLEKLGINELDAVEAT